MLVKYVNVERYSNDEDFNLFEVLKSLNEEYPTDDFKIESVTESDDGDEVVVKVSQTIPFGVEPAQLLSKFHKLYPLVLNQLTWDSNSIMVKIIKKQR